MGAASTELIDRIRDTVSVCRSFRLNGLQEVLKRTELEVTPVALIWQVGDLSAQGYLDSNISSFIVKRDQVQQVKSGLGEELHREWREWYREEYWRYFKVDDLAELIFHEAAILSEGEARLEAIKNKTLQHLWDYYDGVIVEQQLDLKKSFEFDDEGATAFKSAFDVLISRLSSTGDNEKLYEAQHYISNLIEFIKDKELNRFDEVLSKEEYTMFLEFLDDLASHPTE